MGWYGIHYRLSEVLILYHVCYLTNWSLCNGFKYRTKSSNTQWVLFLCVQGHNVCVWILPSLVYTSALLLLCAVSDALYYFYVTYRMHFIIFMCRTGCILLFYVTYRIPLAIMSLSLVPWLVFPDTSDAFSFPMPPDQSTEMLFFWPSSLPFYPPWNSQSLCVPGVINSTSLPLLLRHSFHSLHYFVPSLEGLAAMNAQPVMALFSCYIWLSGSLSFLFVSWRWCYICFTPALLPSILHFLFDFHFEINISWYDQQLLNACSLVFSFIIIFFHFDLILCVFFFHGKYPLSLLSSRHFSIFRTLSELNFWTMYT